MLLHQGGQKGCCVSHHYKRIHTPGVLEGQEQGNGPAAGQLSAPLCREEQGNLENHLQHDTCMFLQHLSGTDFMGAPTGRP